MKNNLIAIIVFAIIVIPYTYFYIPSLSETNGMRQEIANLKASISRFSDGKDIIHNELLQRQKENLDKEKRRLSYLLPDFSVARANLMAPFDTLRQEIPGEWEVVPEGQFKNSDPLVFWPFKFKYSGTTAEAVKLLAYIEVNNQFMRFDSFKMETNKKNDSLVTLSGKVELVFQENSLKGGTK